MPNQDEASGWKPSTRGEQAWKEATDRIASRNAETRKAGRLEREEYERTRDEARRSAHLRRQGKLLRD
jgi:hypothetical protein